MAGERLRELPGASVVIATRQRPGPLAECLASLQQQTFAPLQVIVVDSSQDSATGTVCESWAQQLGVPLLYLASPIRSAAVQRNLGAKRASGEVLVFLDDDVVLEPEFLAELLAPFQADATGELGAVAGTIANATPAQMSRFNRWALRLVLGVDPSACCGRLIGPAVQFPHAGGGGELLPVDWVPSGVCAYRREIFEQTRFGETFEGYSFMEDVDLSARVARRYRLVQATGARLHHKGLGDSSHANWVAHGESRILNRHHVMVDALGKRGPANMIRLFCYEILYSTLAGFWNGGRGGMAKRTILQSIGGLRGAIKILLGKSPHRDVSLTVGVSRGVLAK